MKAESGYGPSGGRWAGAAVLGTGLAAGLAAFAWYYGAGMTLAHYDAKAHLLVARRVLDAASPGYVQFGTHWLPFTHFLYLPLVAFDHQFRTGFLPSLLSVAAFALSGWRIFRIARGITGSAAAGGFAAALALANPNLLYLQSAPLTEPIFMFLMLSAVDAFAGWRERGAERLPWAAAAWAGAGAMCRYEGWLLLAGMLLLVGTDALSGRIRRGRGWAAGALLLGFSVLPALAHFGYLFLAVRDSFLLRVAAGNPAPYETFRRPALSLVYHLGELAQAAGVLQLALGLAGTAAVLMNRSRLRERLILFLLWTPSLLNLAALYWGMMYRVRYSILLIPALSIFAALLADRRRDARRALAAAAALAAFLPWITWIFPGDWRYHMVRAGPGALLVPAAGAMLVMVGWATERFRWPLLAFCLIALQRPALEGEDRPIIAETLEHRPMEPQRARVLECLRKDYDGTGILVDLLKQAPLVYDSGLPLSQVIGGETDGAVWRQALHAARDHAGWLLVSRGDELWRRLRIDPAWADGYSLVLETDNLLLYRRSQPRGE